MKLRNFLYLNEPLLDDYLAALEGSLTTKIITTEKESVERSGSIGGKFLGVESGKNVETETQKEKNLTPSAKVQLFIDYMQTEEEIPFYETMTDEFWRSLSRDEVVEFMGNLRFTKLKEISNAVLKLSELASVFEDITEKSLIDSKTKKAISGFKELSEYKNGNELPCVLSFDGLKDYPVVAYLDDTCLKVSQESFVGDVTILCKIQKKVPKGNSIELTDFFKAFKDLPLNRQQRRAMPNKKDLTTPKEISDTIKGPAFVVIPIAIYK